MKSSKKGGLIVIFISSMGIFGYSQYTSVLQIEVSITHDELLNEIEKGSNYDIELQFENSSLLTLTSGETEFFVIVNDEIVGRGNLDPFTLQPLDSSYVNGIFYTDSNTIEELKTVKITGIIKYDLIITSIDIPFVYYPTEEQASEFIHQN
jgi:hypothetical protein